ncbi:ATPase family associated with various cellular activities (AAA) [Ruminococcaceae bacterium YRB3002]|nr:ATPase family associated with various cellular activities (AAA) [Ruminococcaceae bacterium YRB3002]
MSDIKLTNVPSMNVGQIVDTLAESYSTLINKGLPLATMPSVMLWGPPGVGKSQAVSEIATKMSLLTNKGICVTDVRLLLFNPIDLRGIPTANDDKTLAVWLKPKILDMDPDPILVNILFLDEISAAPPSVQAAAYQIVLDRTVGEHRLPDNCIVIAAGNRMTDKSVTYKMPKALANRLMHIEVEGSFESWKRWAVERGINPKVTGFLSFRQSYLMGFDPSNDDLAFATPRSWEMVSNVLNGVNDDVDKAFPMIAGLVGTGVAVEFRTWTQVYKDLPSVEEIFEGKCVDVPKNTDALYALTSSMTAYAREHSNEMDLIGNSIKYASRMPPDFSVVLLKDYMYLEEGYKARLMRVPEFIVWMRSKGSLLNGID